MTARSIRHPAIRLSFGFAVSALFAYATISRVDGDSLGESFSTLAWPIVASAVLLSAVEVAVRAVRWQRLLTPVTDPGFLPSYALLSIGHLANAVLPARLGDVSRALMAGSRFGVSRTSVLGTIAVERIADTALLAVTGTVGALVGFHAFDAPLAALGVAVMIGVVAAVVAVGLLRIDAIAASRVGSLLLYHGRRFASGAEALRRPGELVRVAALTLASFALAIVLLLVCAEAAGLSMPVWQAGIVIAFLTLSTAIPAGPASLGTYEFVGVAILSSMGHDPAASLLAVALVHAVAVLTPAVIGLGSLWAMGMNPLGSRFGTKVAA